MAANPTPVNDRQLIARCRDLLSGCQAQETEIGIKQNTVARFQPFVDAADAAMTSVGQRKKELGDARRAFREADAEGERVIGRCRLRLAMLFGNRWSAPWQAAGFPDNSTMVPEVFAKRLVLLTSLAGYFTVKPQNASAEMQATAAACAAMHDALGAARSAVNQAHAALTQAVTEKRAALRALRKRMRSLIEEIGQLLPDNDPRWLRFRLNLPAREVTPPAVDGVKATALGHGMVQVQWNPSPHATRYRVQWRTAGTENFLPGETVHRADAVLRELPPGQFIELRVIAANSTDEAVPSEIALVTVA